MRITNGISFENSLIYDILYIEKRKKLDFCEKLENENNHLKKEFEIKKL